MMLDYSSKSGTQLIGMCLDQQDQSLQAYFVDFKKTYEALNSLMPFTPDVRTQQQQREQMATMSFLAGLALRFEAARERVLADSEVPTLQDGYSRIHRSESVKPIEPSDGAPQKALINHMLGNPSVFSTFQPYTSHSPVTLADGSTSKDLTTNKIIGEGRETNGLYLLNTSTPKAAACVGIESPLEIHYRLEDLTPDLFCSAFTESYPYDDDYQVNNGPDYYFLREEPPYDTLSRNFGYSPHLDTDGDNYYEPHGDNDDYDQYGPMCDNQSDPLVEEIIRLEQKVFYFDEVLFAEGSWYEPPYCRDYTLFAEEHIEANKVAIRERAKLLESVRKEKEFERRLCEGSEMMQKMLEDFQRERLEAEAKADKLVNDLCKAVELKRSLQPEDQMREINVQKEALEPKTNPESFTHQVAVLEDSPSSTPSQKPESITTLPRATVVMLPKSLPIQIPASIVVHEVEPTEGPDSEPPMLIQEKKEEEVWHMEVNDHLLSRVKDTPPEEPVLEEIEPTTYPQDYDIQESEEESIDEKILCTNDPIPSIETCANNDSSEDSDHAFFDSLLDGYDYVCLKDGWSQASWDELLASDHDDSSMGVNERIVGHTLPWERRRGLTWRKHKVSATFEAS
ncbi:unnamed protein product [Cuscuta campestris]|uniref:Retrotransposon gag domain-containing protein n=1 Tax=Cuscuta campestris TaxID=132261 RepID=A0A484KA41_9ASTE|nr:unnamed protein product [Cuscuta campestris]